MEISGIEPLTNAAAAPHLSLTAVLRGKRLAVLYSALIKEKQHTKVCCFPLVEIIQSGEDGPAVILSVNFYIVSFFRFAVGCQQGYFIIAVSAAQ